MRNAFVRYTGGAYSRAGAVYCGMCKQGAPNAGGTTTYDPPRDINFQFSIKQGYALEFGDQYMRVKSNGAYVTEANNAITGITNASPGVFTYTNTNYTLSNGDWIYITGAIGLSEFNGLIWIVQNVSGSTFTVTDLFGGAVDTTSLPGYVSGGTLARIYTAVSPYAAIDLPYLKFTQNANLMNLVCWNQATNSEYPPYTLTRVGQTNWVFAAVSFDVSITPPTTVSSTANASTTKSTWYSYEVTSVDKDGNESVASTNTDVFNNDISINAGSNIITWSHVANAVSNNIYAATPIFVTSPFSNPGFTGVPYGFIGTSNGGQQFIDTNIIPDFTITPPLHANPFARGQILDVTPTAAGTVIGAVGFSITTSTGSGFNGTPVTQAGLLVGFDISDNGKNYATADTMTITGMSGASVVLTIGALTGTYPGTVQYFQQRLTYANTINQPDTYFMSQPGLYTNFDASIPTVDSDAIIGTPWAVQINGVQFLVPSIQGLLSFTGNGVWLISGGNSVSITPSNETAQAQAQIGCSAIVPPLFINLHVLYVQSKNSIVRDIAFNFLYNVFTGTDITVYSNHLFLGYTISQWAYSEEPNKLIWAVRNDGKLLSLTYIKEQEIEGWSRHDTLGLYTSICSVIEPPVDAIYTIVKRYITGHEVWAYYSERFDNRIWSNDVEDCFCVDAGLAYPMTSPVATLTPASADGTSNISSALIINGGSGYTSPTATATDSSGAGTGATFSVTVLSGVITAITPLTEGSGYTEGLTTIAITDTTGTGALAQAVITNNVLFTASAAVFSPTQYIYAANYNDSTVSVINPMTNQIVATIAVGIHPTWIAISPDGTQVWVANNSDGSISIIDPVSLTVSNTLAVFSSPFSLAFTPDGTKVYVCDDSSIVYPITVSTLSLGGVVGVGNGSEYICILPNAVTAYVSNKFDGTVTPVTLATNLAGTDITVGNTPLGIAATPDSNYVYVTNSVDGTVSVINASTNLVVSTITVGNTPQGIVVSPNNKFVYVANYGSGSISIISIASNTVVGTISSVGINPNFLSVTADGLYLYVCDGNTLQSSSIVYVISTLTNTIAGAIGVGSLPDAIATSSVNNSAIGTIGDVIRVDGGKATITEYISATQVMANITQPLVLTLPNDPNDMPIPAISGDWTISRPTLTVSGLNHLEGMSVTGLADGGVIVPQIVTDGAIALQNEASAITVGLPFIAQVQTMYLNTQDAVTVQGRRKDIQSVTVRMEASRGVQVGTNQVDASTQPSQADVEWTNMKEIKERNNSIDAGDALPLFTGDSYILVPGDWNTKGQVALQQVYPLPMNALACVPNYTMGDPAS